MDDEPFNYEDLEIFSPSGSFSSPKNVDNLNLFENQYSKKSYRELRLDYQDGLEDLHKHLSSMLETNLREQAKCSEAAASNNKTLRQMTDTNVYAHPYFRDSKDFGPMENCDAKEKRQRNDMMAYFVPPRQWSQKARSQLTEGVIAETMAKVKIELSRNKACISKKLKRKEFEVEYNQLKSDWRKTSAELGRLQRYPKSEFFKKYNDRIDWLKISATTMEGSQSPEDCENFWNNEADPRLNTQSFSPAEDRKLKLLAHKYRERDWDAIANDLKSYRSAIQVFQRYQSCLNDKLEKKFWSKEEDEKLKAVVQKCRGGEHISWNMVCYRMPGWSRVQIVHRWNRVINPNLRVGPFCIEEDAALLVGNAKFGTKWLEISRYLPGRSNYLCRERYCNALDPSLIVGQWTAEEDRMLFRQLAHYGEGKWGLISRNFKGRNDAMVAQRCMILKRHNPNFFKQMKNGKIDTNFIEKHDSFAPTKKCNYINEQRHKVQQHAQEKVFVTVEELFKQNKISKITTCLEDFKNMNLNEVILVIETLLSSNYYSKLKKPSPNYENQEELEKNEASDEEGEDDPSASETCVNSGKERSELVDENVEEKLMERFKKNVKIGLRTMPYATKRNQRVMKEKEILERRELEKVVMEAYNVDCKPVADDLPTVCYGEDDCGKDDGREDKPIRLLLDTFVWPNWVAKEIPILPPNLLTFTAYIIHKMNSNDLRQVYSTCDLTEELHANLYSIVPETRQRMCFNCQIADSSEPSTSSDSADNKCKCEEIREARAEYVLFRKRVLSLFIWPYFLEKNRLSDSQIKAFLFHYRKKNEKKKCEKPKLALNVTERKKKFRRRNNKWSKRRKF